MTDAKMIEMYEHGYSLETIINEQYKNVNSAYGKIIRRGNDILINKEYTKKEVIHDYVYNLIYEYNMQKIRERR